MSENDWWSSLRDNAGRCAGQGEKDSVLTTVSPENSGVNTSGQRFPTPAHNWGSGHAPDPFLEENPSHGADRTVNTPEEAAELRKHAKPEAPEPDRSTGQDIPEPPEKAPPGPPAADAETPSGAASGNDGPEKTGEAPAGIRDRLKRLKEKTGETTAKAAEKTAPARQRAHTTADSVSSSFSGNWSFLWAMGAAWTLAVTFPLALIDRTAMVFGSPRPVFGTEQTEWRFLHGPGVWFGEQLDLYGDSGHLARLVTLCLIGAVPVLFAQLGEKIRHDGLRKASGWIAYGFPVFFTCMPYYFDSMGFRSANELYLSVLAASAWWGFSFSRTLQPGFSRFLLRIPLAAVIVGLGHYAPGAAF